MKEYRIDVKVRNNLILGRMEKKGFPNVHSFCKANNLSPGSVGDVVNMKYPVLMSNGEFSPYIEKLADILECSPYELFTEDQMYALVQTNKKTILVNESEMKFTLLNIHENFLENNVFEDQKQKAIIKSLEILTPRERMVIKERFGIEGKEKTLKEVGGLLGVTAARVRQIESKAMRKMRDPTKNKKIREFL